MISLRSSILRPFRQDDLADLQRIATNPKVGRAMEGGFPQPFTLVDAQEFLDKVIDRDPPCNFAVEYRGAMMGYVGLERRDAEYSEMVAYLDEAVWGRGIIFDAPLAVAKYGFETLGISRIYARCHPWNKVILKALVRGGFVEAGIWEGAGTVDGQPVPMQVLLCLPACIP